MSVALAFLLDLLLGEPPARWHPVVWMGRYLAWAETWKGGGPRRLLLLGGAFLGLGALLVLGLAWGAERLLGLLPAPLAALGLALLLKPLFAFRMLLEEALAVEDLLAKDLKAARARLQSLVSRDTHGLEAEEVREAVLESLAENLNDALIAPLFWFLLLGLPGAALFRFVNTADAMWGYPQGDYRHWGRVAARADDLLAWIPARLTAGLLLGVSRKGSCLRTLLQEARKTPSPNAGWPMAALALALGVRLAKRGVYALNPGGRRPKEADLRLGLHWVGLAGGVGALASALAALWIRGV